MQNTKRFEFPKYVAFFLFGLFRGVIAWSKARLDAFLKSFFKNLKWTNGQ